MTASKAGLAGKVTASVLALGLIAQAGAAAAQTPDYSRENDGPPQGQYAPPPDEQYQDYDFRTQAQDQSYAEAYNSWAARNCVDQRNNNTAAGAVIGGVLGALVGSGVAGRGNHTGGAIVGGALGATAGAAIGSSSSSSSCPPGYSMASGAPAFYYQGYSPVTYGPSWYNPWVFAGGRWTYRPYRYWYYNHPNYWRPGWGGNRDHRRHY